VHVKALVFVPCWRVTGVFDSAFYSVIADGPLRILERCFTGDFTRDYCQVGAAVSLVSYYQDPTRCMLWHSVFMAVGWCWTVGQSVTRGLFGELYVYVAYLLVRFDSAGPVYSMMMGKYLLKLWTLCFVGLARLLRLIVLAAVGLCSV